MEPGTVNGFRLFLRLGDKVHHRDYTQWGEGSVVEEMTSTVPGGTCLVRILFEDGKQRTFSNDLEADTCCYYFGIRKLWNVDEKDFAPVARKRTARRLLR